MIRFKEASAPAGRRRRAVALLINEEDHLRIQVLEAGSSSRRPGRAPQDGRRAQAEAEIRLSRAVRFLTSCPTNTGTGLRASVLIHLPGLVLTREIHKVLQGLAQIGLTFRGLYGEAPTWSATTFRSPIRRPWESEAELVGHLSQITRQVIEYEENAAAGVAGRPRRDRGQGVAGLRTPPVARAMSTDEMMNLARPSGWESRA